VNNQNRQNLQRKKKQEDIDKLVLTRSSLLYGLVIEKFKSDKISINRGVTSTPTFIFYSNNTKCFVDYTNQLNSDVETKISDYFNSIKPGTTVTLTNALYRDPASDEIANLNGNFVFRQINNGIVSLDVTSVDSLSTKINRYDKRNFDEIPYFTATTVSKYGTSKTIIKNRFGKNTKNSFNYLGILPGDYIKIENTLSNPAKILDISIDSDGNEFIVIDKIIDEVDLTNLQTKVDVYLEVKNRYNAFVDTREAENGFIGACIIYSNDVIVSCTDNNTFSQCNLRANSYDNLRTEITFDTFCRTPENDTAVQTSQTDSLIQLTSTLASALANVGSNVSGPISKNGNSRNSFYGRPF
jgi:hypothetical protein